MADKYEMNKWNLGKAVDRVERVKGLLKTLQYGDRTGMLNDRDLDVRRAYVSLLNLEQDLKNLVAFYGLHKSAVS